MHAHEEAGAPWGLWLRGMGGHRRFHFTYIKAIGK